MASGDLRPGLDQTRGKRQEAKDHFSGLPSWTGELSGPDNALNRVVSV